MQDPSIYGNYSNIMLDLKALELFGVEGENPNHAKFIKWAYEMRDALSADKEYVERLEMHLKKLIEGYEQWEADIISNNELWWPNVEEDVITGKLYDDMMLLQEQRNEAKAALQSKNSNNEKI